MKSDRFAAYEQNESMLRTLETQHAFYCRPPTTRVFSDEAGTHHNARFFGIGCLMVWQNTLTGKAFALQLQTQCKACHWSDEFKWSYVSRGNLHRYRDFTAMFFDGPHTVQFHCIIVDRERLSGKRKSYDMLFRFYYLLLAHRLNPTAQWRANRRSMLIPDRLDLPAAHWSRLFHSVNASLKRKYEVRHYPIVQCWPTDSKVCLELQLTDVLLGSVVAQYNADFQSPHKKQLSTELVQKLIGCGKPKASIWEWQPMKQAMLATSLQYKPGRFHIVG